MSEEVIQLVQQRRDAVAGLWWGLVVRVGLYPLATGSVAEMMGYPPGVLPLGFSDAAGQVGPGCPQTHLVSCFDSSVLSLQEPVDLFSSVTSSMRLVM